MATTKEQNVTCGVSAVLLLLPRVSLTPPDFVAVSLTPSQTLVAAPTFFFMLAEEEVDVDVDVEVEEVEVEVDAEADLQ